MHIGLVLLRKKKTKCIKFKSTVQIWVHSILYLWSGDRGSFPVRGSFAVQIGDHFRSGDHLWACTVSRSFKYHNFSCLSRNSGSQRIVPTNKPVSTFPTILTVWSFPLTFASKLTSQLTFVWNYFRFENINDAHTSITYLWPQNNL